MPKERSNIGSPALLLVFLNIRFHFYHVINLVQILLIGTVFGQAVLI